MAAITVTPAQPLTGQVVSIVGSEFKPATVCTLQVEELGVEIEVTSDAAGYFGTTDVADHAVATLTSDATNVSAGDTVTIGSVTYRFESTMAQINDVKIGADAATTLANLKKAVNATGTEGTEYYAGTVINPDAAALTLTATTLLLYAKVGGTGGNALDSTEASTHLSFGGATFAGGSASSGANALLLDFEEPGTYHLHAVDDGTNEVTAQLRVFEG
jgi:hypothetical protein